MMLKVIVLLECDLCGGLYAQSMATADTDGLMWACLADEVQGNAEQSGWDLFRGRHVCYGCLNDAEVTRPF